MSKALLKILEEKILVSDGAMGTMLQSSGLGEGECQEEWNLTHPEAVQDVHRQYIQSGCNLISTNTFGGNRVALKKFGKEDKVKEFNSAAVKIAREMVGENRNVFILGDVGPTGDFLEPVGTLTFEGIYDIFREQTSVLKEAGVDALIVETMSCLRETQAAVKAARETGLSVLASISFSSGKKGFRTMMGLDISSAVKGLEEAGADVIGTNCGSISPEEMAEIIREMRSLTGKPLLAQPNAGKPALIDGKTVYTRTPDSMAVDAGKLIEAGANILGGCCGTTPEHLKSIARVAKCMHR